MMPEIAPPVAAPAVETPSAPVTAVDQAVAGHDVAAFRSARAAERTGKPIAPTPAPAADPDDDAADDARPPTPAAAPAAPVRTVSKRQQQINDYERRLAEQTAELTRLRAQMTAPPAAAAPAAPATPATPTIPDHKRFAAMADAPNEDAFETYSEYTAALSLFIADKRYEERDQARTARDQQTQHERAIATRDDAFRSRVDQARAADPTFDTRVTPAITALAPIEAVVAAGKPVTSLNALATEFLENDLGPQLMVHFSEHPEDLQRFARLQPRQFLLELGKLETLLTPALAPAAEPPKTVSSAPEPPRTLGSRPADTANPIDSAVASRDVSAFRAARLAERTARQR